MLTTSRFWLILFALVLATPSAFGQALPDAVRNAGVTVDQWNSVQAEVKRAAAARGASELALAAVAQRMSTSLVHDEKVDLEQVLSLIDGRAQELVALQNKLSAMESADDPSITRLLVDANAAINAGDLTGGDQLLARAAESDLAAIALDKAKLAARQIRAAETIGERGRLANLSADYLGASKLYSQAAETVPATELSARWSYRMQQAEALYERGRLFNEPQPLSEALTVYRALALPLVPRERAQSDWTTTQNNLGNVLSLLGERGDERALVDAIAAFKSALEVGTREAAPAAWARTQQNLGVALSILGERGAEQALRDAVSAYQSALEIRTRELNPEDWAQVQNNLGNVFQVLGERGDYQALQNAVVTYRSALEVRTRERNPEDWAMTQNNLGIVLGSLGERGDDVALRDAIAAYQSALEVNTRERAPAEWARIQHNLGNALSILGERGDEEALQDALAAYRSALEVRARESAPRDWAITQTSLGLALQTLGERGDDQALLDALMAYRAALEVNTREAAPAEWAILQFNMALAFQAMDDNEPSARAGALAAARAALDGFLQINVPALANKARRLVTDLEAPH